MQRMLSNLRPVASFVQRRLRPVPGVRQREPVTAHLHLRRQPGYDTVRRPILRGSAKLRDRLGRRGVRIVLPRRRLVEPR